MRRKVSKLLCFFMVLSIFTTFFSVQAFSAPNDDSKPSIVDPGENTSLMPKLSASPIPTPTIPIIPTPKYDMIVQISSVKAIAGKEVQIPIFFRNVPSIGINNLDFKLSFDPKVLRIIEIQPGDIVINPRINFSYGIKESTMSFMFIDETGSGTENINTSGIFATIKAIVNTEPLMRSTSINLQKSDGVFADFNTNSITTNFISSQIMISPPQIENLSVEINKVKGFANGTFEVPVRFVNVPQNGIMHFDFALSYNPKELEVMDVVPGDLLIKAPKECLNFSIDSKGQVYFLFLDESVDGTYSIKNSGTAFILKVKVKPEAPVNKLSPISLYPTNGVFGDPNLDIIPVTFTDGGIYVVESVVPTPTPTPTPTISPRTVKLSAMDVEGRVGDTIKIPLKIENVPSTGINNGNFKIIYDSQVLNIIDIVPGSIMVNPKANFMWSNFPEKCSISFLYIDESGIGNGLIKNSGDFAVIIAKIVGTDSDGIPGVSVISIPDKPVFSDFNLTKLSVATKSGLITILPPSKLVGDLNDDKLIDSTDLAMMKRFILELINDFPVDDDLYSGDLNRDGSIDSIDLAVLKRFILGIYTQLPI